LVLVRGVLVWTTLFSYNTKIRSSPACSRKKARVGISYTWRSIIDGINLLKEGIIWRVVSGSNVNIWTDPWIPRGTTKRPITPRGGSLITKVSDLMDPSTGTWDESLITDVFWPEDAEAILMIPTDYEAVEWPAWHYDSKGVFSVKSAYKLAVQIRDQQKGTDASTSMAENQNANGFRWGKLWQLNIPNKIKMFLWHFAHNSLPLRRNIARRGVKLDTRCPIC